MSAPANSTAPDDQEERSMAALAHGSILLNVFMPPLGIVAAFAVWLIQRDRSVYAARHALQATVYQLLWVATPVVIAILGIIAFVTGAITAAAAESTLALVLLVMLFVIGVLAILFIVFAGIIYALVAAYEAYQGRDFRYWLVGRLVH